MSVSSTQFFQHSCPKIIMSVVERPLLDISLPNNVYIILYYIDIILPIWNLKWGTLESVP